MNLLFDPWIDVYERNTGKKRRISPLEIVTESFEKDLAGSSWEVNTGSLFFLYNLVQTYLAPETDAEWVKGFSEPPASLEDFKEIVEPDKEAFELSRFMQVPEDRRSDIKVNYDRSVEGFFVSAYGDNSVKRNTLMYHKGVHDLNRGVTKEETASLLMLLCNMGGLKQMGNGTSCVRGNGTVTFMLEGDTLWQTIWLNVLNRPEMDKLFGTEHPPKFFYPWMEDPTFGKAINKKTTIEAEHYHPLTALWFMLRDIVIPPNTEGKITHIFADVYDKKRTGKDGPKWGSGWIHPLSPYTEFYKDSPLPVVPKVRTELNAGDWTFLRYGEANREVPEGSQPRKAANVIAFERRCKRYYRALGLDRNELPPIRVFGPSISQSTKVDILEDRRFPMMTYDPDIRDAIVLAAKVVVSYVDKIQNRIYSVIRKFVEIGRPEVDLWSVIDTSYYEYLGQVIRDAQEGRDSEPEVLENFLGEVNERAFGIYETRVGRDTSILPKIKREGGKINNTHAEADKLKRYLRSQKNRTLKELR